MPLSRSTPRKLIHTRQIHCYGYEREDGLYDIEAHMSDVKSYSFNNKHRGEVNAGEPIHDMWIRLTVDENLKVHAAEACTDASPYRPCPEIAGRYKQLEGMHIGPGWNLASRKLFRGVEGCTHLTELLGPVATAAYQTIIPKRKHRGDVDPQKKPAMLNSCHAYSSRGQVVQELWPQFYRGDEKPAVGE
jgi:hypothetical protein